ncbi:uncharacterized protein LOC118435642 [Folsomia candida]|nr:uncharacterized protein LOC118435642 [Folsomia candida]
MDELDSELHSMEDRKDDLHVRADNNCLYYKMVGMMAESFCKQKNHESISMTIHGEALLHWISQKLDVKIPKGVPIIDDEFFQGSMYTPPDPDNSDDDSQDPQQPPETLSIVPFQRGSNSKTNQAFSDGHVIVDNIDQGISNKEYAKVLAKGEKSATKRKSSPPSLEEIFVDFELDKMVSAIHDKFDTLNSASRSADTELD